MKQPICIDCIAEGITTFRPTHHVGPRTPLCASHILTRRRKNSARAHELRIEKHFGLSGDDYQLLYFSQEGRCFVCRRATGKAKRLAVDHDHHRCTDHPPDIGCRHCIRCLACGPCNELLGRYDVEALVRAIIVLKDPPAQKVLHDARR
jgi:Recombination endonuclease VII